MNARVIVLQTFPNSFSDKCRTYSTKDNDNAQKPRKHPFEFFHSVEKQKKELLEFSLSLRKVERDPVLSKDFFLQQILSHFHLVTKQFCPRSV